MSIRTPLLVLGILACITTGAAGAESLDVGSRKQLFIDEKFIESARGVELVMNPPYQTGEVLITADQAYEEGGIVYLYSSVLKEDDGRVRIWYDIYTPTGPGPFDHERRVAYAESDDGVHFTKPALGLHELNGSKANNVVLPGVIGGCSVWIDPKAPPEHRYKTQAKVYPSGEYHMFSSPDGLSWSQFANIDPKGPHDTQTIIFWDKKLQRYLLYGRLLDPAPESDVKARKVRRGEMIDLTEIDNTGLVIWPDDVDRALYGSPVNQPAVDYYGATVFQYEEAEDAYIMLAQTFWHWMSGDAPGTRDVRLAISRDSRNFQRVGDRKPFLRPGPAGRFDSKQIWALPNPIVMGDEIWIYYAGTNRDRVIPSEIDPATPGGEELGAISRAIMRLDGFISADATYEGGELVTPVIRFSGNELQLNVDTSAGGSIKVEILDASSTPIPGFTEREANWLNANSVRASVSWKARRDVTALAGQSIRLRFVMRDCKLYAFQFVE